MKILAVSDSVDEHIYSSNLGKNIPGVELIIGCGDLPFEYLEFLVSIYNVPLLYVPGNHDPQYNPKKTRTHAEGCENIDGRVVQVKGMQIAGLGGSILYKPHAINQYTQARMWRRAFQLAFRYLWGKWLGKGELDIFIAHSPPMGFYDDTDPAHQGFSSFSWLIKVIHPRYFLHGHTLNIRYNLDGHNSMINGARIINVNPHRILEMEINAG